MVKNKTIKAIFLLMLLLIPIGKVIAGISITPAFIRMDKAMQGKKYVIPVTVTNQSAKKTEYFKVFVDGPSKLINGVPASKVIRWTTVKPKNITIQPGESRKIKLTVQVPKGYIGDYRIYLSILQDPKKYNLNIKKRKIKSNVGIMQLGKTSTRLPEFKTHIKALVKVNVPVVIRAIKPGQKIKLKTRQISLGKLSASPSLSKAAAMTVTAKLKNKSRFDVLANGTCTILNKKGSKKLMQTDFDQKMIIQPKVTANIDCNFSSPLPRGSYRVQADIKAQVKGSRKQITITKRQKLKINKLLAQQISGRGTIGDDNQITTPLLLSPNMIQQEIFGGKIRKLVIEVVNPTVKKVSISSKFNLTNDNRVKAIIKPKKFKLAAGSSKRVSVEFKSKNKKSPIFGYLEFTTRDSKGASPASIPVILLPEGIKQKQQAKISNFKAVLTAGGSRIHFSANAVSGKKGKESLYLTSSISLTDVESGVLTFHENGSLSSEHLLPGNSVNFTGGVDFDKLDDGVYTVLLKISSEEGGLAISNKVNMVVNRDIAQKIKLVINE
ncbi:MAG: hypothetical protein NZ824_01275 [Candidatus Thioglobus sp.]|nr:hypothetical protein [Candidatus Thioglobus sp.]